jgi:hypothetical protein
MRLAGGVFAVTLPVLLVLLAAACGGEADRSDIAFDAQAVVTAAADRLEHVAAFHFVLEHEGGTTRIVQGMEMTRAEGVSCGRRGCAQTSTCVREVSNYNSAWSA